jgi:hypothetical protein
MHRNGIDHVNRMAVMDGGRKKEPTQITLKKEGNGLVKTGSITLTIATTHGEIRYIMWFCRYLKLSLQPCPLKVSLRI